MLKHLNKKNKRLINHLTLLNENRQQCPVSQLATFSACSERTVYSDIDLIDYYYDDLLDLDIVSGQVIMKNYGSGSLNYVIKDIIIHDLNFQLLINFYTDAFEPVEHYAVKNAVSVQTVHNARKVINQALSQYNLEVVSLDGAYTLIGESDCYLQLLMAHFLDYSDYSPDENFFIMWDHFKNNYDLSNITNHYFTIEKDVRAIYMSSYIKLKNKGNKPNYEQVSENFFNLINYLIKVENELETYVEGYLDLLYPLIHENNFVYNKQTISLFKEMLLHAFTLNYVLRANTYTSQFRIKNFMLTFKRENKIFYQKSLDIMKKLNPPQEISHIALTDTIIYLSYLNFKSIRNYKRCRILVVSDLSIKHAETMVQRFDKHFPMHQFTPFYKTHKRAFETFDFSPYHYIVSTRKIKNIPNEVITYVKDFPDSEDFKNLYELLYY